MMTPKAGFVCFLLVENPFERVHLSFFLLAPLRHDIELIVKDDYYFYLFIEIFIDLFLLSFFFSFFLSC